nr:hypothetical protein [Tanacetum cinerariifolium]
MDFPVVMLVVDVTFDFALVGYTKEPNTDFVEKGYNELSERREKVDVTLRVMPALDIPVLADGSIETSIPLVILSDTKTEIAPKVEATGFVSSARVPQYLTRLFITIQSLQDHLIRDVVLFPRLWPQMLLLNVVEQMPGEPRYEMEEGPLAQIHPITSEPIHHTIPLLMARLVHLDRQIEKNHDHQREVSVARVETSELEIEAPRARAASAEAHVAILHDVLRITGDRIGYLEFQVVDAEFRLHRCERGWIQDRARIRRLEEHLAKLNGYGSKRRLCK